MVNYKLVVLGDGGVGKSGMQISILNGSRYLSESAITIHFLPHLLKYCAYKS